MKKKCGALCLMLLASVLSALAQHVSVFVTSKAGDRLASRPELDFQPESGRNLAGFRIGDSVVYQKYRWLRRFLS